jgi:hypothetical protein
MKKSLLTLLAAASVLSAANAQTVVDIGGSTAGRSGVHARILAILENETYAYNGTSSASAAASAIYHGTYAGNTYIIRTFWAGSVNGIEDVRLGTQQTALIDKTVLGNSGGQNIASPTFAPASAETAFEIGFSDIFASTIGQTATTVEDEVAVITFKWFANEGSTGISNITPSMVRTIYGAAEVPKSLFTGNSSDTSTVYPVGRNSDSGTRGTAMAESGYGNIVAVDQNTATIVSGAITAIVPSGNTGYSSGSSVKNVMNATYAGGTAIGYLGASDFAAEGVALKWNGVDYSEAAIQNGSYTFWGYLHQNRMTLTGNALAFYTGLKGAMETTPGTGLLTVGSMNVQRDADGAPVYPK